VAQWNRSERTLLAKIVYYGPALGGKTTNLRSLHDITDPDRRQKLVSVATADDRTLFFDLLPFELGSVLGYKVAVKCYTVPGQVRYDTTRRVVLAGADAVVFVADSDPAREHDNRVSWDNLRKNLRANGLDPAALPILVQLNKRDVPGAVPAGRMEAWFGLTEGQGLPAVACAGQGVLETFVPACRAMLERLVGMADPSTRRSLDAGDPGGQVERAFSPLLARRRPVSLEARATDSVVLDGADLLASAVAAGAELGGRLADEHARAVRLAREAEALRALSEVVRGTGASFDRDVVVDAALDAVVRTIDAAGAALVAIARPETLTVERTAGLDLGELVRSRAVGSLLARMASVEGVSVVDDLASEVPRGAGGIDGLKAIALLPVEAGPRTALLVAMPAPDGAITDHEIQFLATLCSHLAVGIDKVRTHAEIRKHRDRLEQTVRDRTRELRRAYEDLKSVDAMKDRFLANVSHEMRSPLTAIIGAATFLKDYEGQRAQREEMAAAILHAAGSLAGLLDGLLRVAGLESAAAVAQEPVPPAELVTEALALSGGGDRVTVSIDPRVAEVCADRRLLARALANLLDNAIKFGPVEAPVEVRVGACTLVRSGAGVRGIAIAVLDRGPGVPEEEVDRVFVAFEQGGDPLTSKPGGVGLGLYEARTIVRRHGGTLIHLPRPGGGSEFRISLPAGAEAGAEPVAAEARGA
jgi:signal transduction histidine kinase/signal recognition particle receptor subunit beta